MNIKSIIKEEIQNIIDGVGDRYAEKAFRIPDAEQRDYMRQTQPAVKNDPVNGEMVGYVVDKYKNNRKLSPIYKNPTSLQNFEPDVRAINDKDGNLYVALIDGSFIHNDMESALPSGFDTYNLNDNMTWHRIGRTNKFGFSDSMEDYITGSGDETETLNRINQLNKQYPQFDFIPIYYDDV